MYESEMDMDCEIECLDEDVEIVQQYVLKLDDSKEFVKIKEEPLESSSLLEEKPDKSIKKKIKKEEEDSDYDPSEEYRQRFKRKMRPSRPIFKRENERTSKYDLKIRRQLDIRIPDYEDPLCLPVRAWNREDGDLKKLRNWNNLCLKHMKMYELPLRPDTKDAVSSTRTIVLRNLNTRQTGKVETTMWSKISVENEDGMKKSEIVQAMLPKYREKKFLKSVVLGPKQTKPVNFREEVILTKEFDKDEEMLIAYKPKSVLSCTYKMFEKESEGSDDDSKKYLRELVVCKMCVPCYQTSWRGVHKGNNTNIKCSICDRVCVSVYNLLSHVRSHSTEDVKAHKKEISKSLSEVLQYHYECRICPERCDSIKALKAHVNTHKGSVPFVCEIGDHVAS
ncbi:unnamed protein product [Pieris brassicae]|uniref:C2H2-type domain-containing protein n=1 Tax=Pieris brassicae TaxID=7116 RepID=A0A9P0XEY7_PIEBR|nr:unnamed protein product [Pieris brassicae]